jgi:hypothetical protein
MMMDWFEKSARGVVLAGCLMGAQSIGALSFGQILGNVGGAVDALGQSTYTPLIIAGSAIGLGYKGAQLIKAHPKIAGLLGAYALLANNGRLFWQGKDFITERLLHMKLSQDMATQAQTVGGLAYDHINNNKELVAAMLALTIVTGLWDTVIGKSGSLAIDGLCKEIGMPAVGGLYLANWAYDKARYASTLYHDMLDNDATLRPSLMLVCSTGSINGWKIGEGDMIANITAQIDRELAKIATLQERLVRDYIPNAPDMLKEAKKAAGITSTQRHHSTEEREEKYWDWINEKAKDPYSTKPNNSWVQTKKSFDALMGEYTIKIPNIFWRIYSYYEAALKAYAGLEERKERLVALRELMQTRFATWWKEYQESL